MIPLIPKIISLSEEEKRVLDDRAFELLRKADDFSSKLCEWMRKDERFLDIIGRYPEGQMEKDVNDECIRIVSLNEEKGGKFVETCLKLGASVDDILAIYDACYERIESYVESLDFDLFDKTLLKSAIRKRVEREIFIHLKNFEDLQKERLEERENELSKIRNFEKCLEEIQRSLTTNLPPDMIYGKVVKIIGEYLKEKGNVKIAVPSSDSEWMIILFSEGEDSKFFLNPKNSQMISIDPNRYPEGQIVTSKCFREGKPLVVYPEVDPVYISYWGKYPDLIKVRVLASWPIIENGKPVAVLTIGSYDPNFFTKEITVLIDQIVSSVEMTIERYKKDEKLEWMGLHDPLTNLPNKIYFEQSARNAMKYANRGHKKIAIGLINIDNFRSWNNLFGHESGDELLKRIGIKIEATIRGGDVIARMGGDEFLIHVLLDKFEELDTITKRIKDTLSAVDRRMDLSCTIGWAVYPDDASDLNDLINLAHKKMYTQKKNKY